MLIPDSTNAVAIQIPPENKIKIPHGIFTAVSQSKSFSPLPFGIKNNAIAPTIATLASFAIGILKSSLHPPKGSCLVTHASAVNANTHKVLFSSVLQLPVLGTLNLLL